MSLESDGADPVTGEGHGTAPGGESGRAGGRTLNQAPGAPRWRALASALPSFPRGLRYMALGAFFFSFMSLLVKLGGRRLPTQEMVLARSATMLLLSWLGLRRAGLSWIGARHRPLLVIRGAFGFAALSCFYFALVRLPLGDANVIQFTNPAFTALFATWVLGERLRLREVGAVATSLAGVTLIARPSFLFGGASALDPRVVGIAVLGAVCSAAAYVTVRRAEGVHALVIIFYFSLVSVIGSIPAGWSAMVWPTPAEWLLLFAIGATTQIAQMYMTRGFQLERAGRAAAVGYLQVVFAATWGALAFHELPDLATLGGFALIIAATLALARSEAPAAAELPLRTDDVPMENAS